MRISKYIALAGALLLATTAQAVPDIQQWKTENGAEVLFVPSPGLPMVDIRVVFDGGAARDGDKPGRALLTNALLAEGAGGLDADELARRFDDVGARFGNSSLRDMALLSLRTLTEPDLMQPAVEAFATVVARPDFPEQAIERERQRVLVAIRNREQSPGEVIEEAFWREIYGDHPYGTVPLGTRESIQALSRDDLINHYKQYYVANNAVVAIVGDLDRSGAERLAEAVVGKLSAGEAAPELPEVPVLDQAERRDIQFPSSQTHIMVGQPGMARGGEDYFPLYVGNHVLGGGGLVSRIAEEVREKRGLSYSAYSHFTPMARRGPYILGLQTANENATEALKVLRQTLEQFVAEGPTAEELEAAKKNLVGSFALNVDSNSDLVQYLSMIGFYDLPLDYLDTFIDNVEAVTVESVTEAYRSRIHPDRMVTVTVGGAR